MRSAVLQLVLLILLLRTFLFGCEINRTLSGILLVDPHQDNVASNPKLFQIQQSLRSYTLHLFIMFHPKAFHVVDCI
jgi:hypothetical protein